MDYLDMRGLWVERLLYVVGSVKGCMEGKGWQQVKANGSKKG